MKILKVFFLAVSCALCLAGCSSEIEEDIVGSTTEDVSANNSDTDVSNSEKDENNDFQLDIELLSNRINISDYKSQFESDIAEVKSSEYKNIDLKDADILSLGDVEKVGIYQLCPKGMEADESIEIIKNWLADIGCSDLDLEKELRDAGAQYADERTNAEYPYDYVAVYDYYPEFDSGEGFFINTNRCYIQMGNSGIYSMSDGSITEYLNSDKLAARDALGSNSEIIVSSGKVSDMADEEWELVSGNVKVGDAAKVVKEYFEAGTPGPNYEGISVDVPEVKVFELGDKYGYAFTVRRVFCGVPFAYSETGYRTFYDYYIYEDMKTAYMINGDTVAAYTGYSEAEQLESLIEEQEDILSLKDAVSYMSDFLASNLMFKVNKAELVYCICEYEEENQIIYPCWQFEGINITNSQEMRVYVNALSGDVYYYSFREE